MNGLNTPYIHGDKGNKDKGFCSNIADTLLSDVDKIFLAGNTEIKSKADLAKIVEMPCLAACEQLFDKNILTYWSSSNKESPNKAEILIRYESLDEKNKKIARDLSDRGILSITTYLDSGNTAEEYGPAVILRIDTNLNMTVNEISEQLCEIAMNFVPQNIKYNVYTPDYLLQYDPFNVKPKTIFGFPSLERTIMGNETYNIYSPRSERGRLYDDVRDFLRLKTGNKLSGDDMKKIATMIGRIYNEEDGFLYKDEETLRRHNEYMKNQTMEQLNK